MSLSPQINPMQPLVPPIPLEIQAPPLADNPPENRRPGQPVYTRVFLGTVMVGTSIGHYFNDRIPLYIRNALVSTQWLCGALLAIEEYYVQLLDKKMIVGILVCAGSSLTLNAIVEQMQLSDDAQLILSGLITVGAPIAGLRIIYGNRFYEGISTVCDSVSRRASGVYRAASRFFRRG